MLFRWLLDVLWDCCEFVGVFWGSCGLLVVGFLVFCWCGFGGGGVLLGCCWGAAGVLLGCCWGAVGVLLGCCWGAVAHILQIDNVRFQHKKHTFRCLPTTAGVLISYIIYSGRGWSSTNLSSLRFGVAVETR